MQDLGPGFGSPLPVALGGTGFSSLNTGSLIFCNSASAFGLMSVPTAGKILGTDGSGFPNFVHGIDPGIAGGRLTAQQDTPVPTSDQTSSTLYYEPYNGRFVALYDGTLWALYDITAGPSLAIGGLTTGKNYDVFAYVSAGAATLEASAAWTNDTTRADALALQDGVWVKSGTTTRRYLGTIRTVTVSTVKCTDSNAQRFVWNMRNRVKRVSYQLEDDASWAISGSVGTWVAMNAAGADGDWKHESVVGWNEDDHEASWNTFASLGAGTALQGGIKWDWSSGAPTQMTETVVAQAGPNAYAVLAEKRPAIGYHYTQAICALAGSGNSTTIYGSTRAVFNNVCWA